MRLIDADALETKAVKMHGFGDAKFISLNTVRNATTIDPADLIPKGRWESVKPTGIGATARCSNCGDAIYGFRTMNFCPNCGAKMEE